MPSIEEAWNLPISAEMSSRQQQQQQMPGGPSYKYGTAPSGPPPPYPQVQGQNLNAKRFKVIEDKSVLYYSYLAVRNERKCLLSYHQSGDEAISPQRPPPFYLSSQQLQMLQFLQQNHSSLTPHQQLQLAQLQHQYRAMQHHQQQIRQQQAAQRGLRPGQPGYPAGYGHPPTGQSGVIKNYGIPQQPVKEISNVSLTKRIRDNCKVVKLIALYKFI